MLIRMDIFKDGVMVESYVVPDSSWIKTKSMGTQYAYPVKSRERTSGTIATKYSYLLYCSPVEPVPDIPEALIDLVNSDDKRYGRNGHEWIGCHRQNQDGTEIDRIREYVNNAVFHNDNQLFIDEFTLRKLKEGL